MADLNSTSNPSDRKPSITSLQDLLILENRTVESEFLYTTFYHCTSDEEVYFGQSFKSQWNLTLAEYNSGLERINDDEIHPKIPEDAALTIAPDTLDDTSAFYQETRSNQL